MHKFSMSEEVIARIVARVGRRHRIEALGSQKIGEVLVITKGADRLNYEKLAVLGNLRLLDQEFLTIGFLPINANYRFACNRSFRDVPSPEIAFAHMLAATPSLFDQSSHCY